MLTFSNLKTGKTFYKFDREIENRITHQKISLTTSTSQYINFDCSNLFYERKNMLKKSAVI